MNWDDIKIKDYKVLQQLQKDYTDEELIIEMVSYLYDVRADQIPITDYLTKVRELAFMSEDIKPRKVASEYIINNHKYTFQYHIEDLTTAQFFDYLNYAKEKDNEVDILSVILIPNLHKYNDGYDMEEVKSDLECMSIVDYVSINTFFLRVLKRYIKVLIHFLKMGRMRAEKSEREQIDTLINQIITYCHIY